MSAQASKHCQSPNDFCCFVGVIIKRLRWGIVISLKSAFDEFRSNRKIQNKIFEKSSQVEGEIVRFAKVFYSPKPRSTIVEINSQFVWWSTRKQINSISVSSSKHSSFPPTKKGKMPEVHVQKPTAGEVLSDDEKAQKIEELRNMIGGEFRHLDRAYVNARERSTSISLISVVELRSLNSTKKQFLELFLIDLLRNSADYDCKFCFVDDRQVRVEPIEHRFTWFFFSSSNQLQVRQTNRFSLSRVNGWRAKTEDWPWRCCKYGLGQAVTLISVMILSIDAASA